MTDRTQHSQDHDPQIDLHSAQLAPLSELIIRAELSSKRLNSSLKELERALNTPVIRAYLNTNFGEKGAIATITIKDGGKGNPQFQRSSNPGEIKLVIPQDSNAISRWLKTLEASAQKSAIPLNPHDPTVAAPKLIQAVLQWIKADCTGPVPSTISAFKILFPVTEKPLDMTSFRNVRSSLRDTSLGGNLAGERDPSPLHCLEGHFSDEKLVRAINREYERAEQSLRKTVDTFLRPESFDLNAIPSLCMAFNQAATLSILRYMALPDLDSLIVPLSFNRIHAAFNEFRQEQVAETLERFNTRMLESLHDGIRELLDTFSSHGTNAALRQLFRYLGQPLTDLERTLTAWRDLADESKRILTLYRNPPNRSFEEAIRRLENHLGPALGLLRTDISREQVAIGYVRTWKGLSEALCSIALSNDSETESWFRKTFHGCFPSDFCEEEMCGGFICASMAILNCYDRQETGGKLPLLIEHDSILAPIIHASFIGLVRYNSERAFHASSEMSEEQFQSSIERIKELIGAFDGADTPPFIPTQLRFLRLIPQLQHAALMVREHAHHDSIQHVLDILNNVYEKLTVLPSLTQANDGQLLLKACESTRGVCLKLRETGFPGSALSIAERVQMLVERTAILNPSPESAALSDTVKSEVYSLGNEMTEFAKCAKDFDRSSLANIRKEFKLWKPHPEGNLKLWRETLLKRYPIVSHQ